MFVAPSRTADICEQLKRDGLEDYIRDNTGLVVDPVIPGTQSEMDPDHVEGSARTREAWRRAAVRYGGYPRAYLEDDAGRVHVT